MGKRYGMKGWLCAALAAVCLLAALPEEKIFARDYIDKEHQCSLTVKTEILVTDAEEENSDWAELNETEIQVYLYRLADVDEYGEYAGIEGFEKLELEKVDGDTQADDWREMARAASDILGLPIPPKAEDTAKQPGPAGEMELPENLPEKLEKADARISVKGGSGTADGLKQGMYLVWVMPVYTEEYQYTFLPYLVSLPNNSYDAKIPDSVDEWDYKPSVGLKPRQNILYGNLKIRKTLNTYNGALGEAVFVFQIEARKDLNHDGDKEVVYSNVLALSFDAAGEKEAVIEHIPAGAEVTVEEVYSGSAYKPSGSKKEDTTVSSEKSGKDMAEVSFTNDYDNTVIYGTGAVNRFTHGENGWSGVRVPED